MAIHTLEEARRIVQPSSYSLHLQLHLPIVLETFIFLSFLEPCDLLDHGDLTRRPGRSTLSCYFVIFWVLIEHDQTTYHGRLSTECVQRRSLISHHRFRGRLDHSADRCCYPSLALPTHVESGTLGKIDPIHGFQYKASALILLQIDDYTVILSLVRAPSVQLRRDSSKLQIISWTPNIVNLLG